MRNEAWTALLLAAGVGRRLGGSHDGPKVLLEFGGRSLLARHLAALAAVGAAEVTIVTGHEAAALEAAVEAAVAALAPALPVRFVHNPRFTEGSVVSLAAGAGVLRSGRPVLLMDGDVLYDARMLRRLGEGAADGVMLVDRELDPGDEPVKICFDANGRIVDFRKRPAHPGVRHGESVGFFRFAPGLAAALADQAEAYAAGAGAALEYEEAIRHLLLAAPDRFAAVDVTDLPWTEIDFPEDVARARAAILPALEER